MPTWTNPGGSSPGRTTLQSVQSTTESAPTGASEGAGLEGVGTVQVVAQAPSGQTFDGTGSLLGYVLPPDSTVWVRAPRCDLEMDDANGLAAVSLPSLEVASPAGRFALVCSGVGLSGGTEVTLTLTSTSIRR
jgi:hypothetical protein